MFSAFFQTRLMRILACTLPGLPWLVVRVSAGDGCFSVLHPAAAVALLGPKEGQPGSCKQHVMSVGITKSCLACS